MKTPLQYIESFGCSTTSYIAAVQHLTQLKHDKETYEQGIADIIGLSDVPQLPSLFEARTLFLYVVQETIRGFQRSNIPIMEEIYIEALRRTEMFLIEHPWAQTQFNIQHGVVIPEQHNDENSDQGNSKRGAKKNITEKLFKDMKAAGKSRTEIIKAFVEQIGMSKAGATTYFHALKNQYGFTDVAPSADRSKTESKQQIAEQLFQQAEDKSKSAIIPLFVEKLGTSKLGAQTYFYACKKKFVDCPTQ